MRGLNTATKDMKYYSLHFVFILDLKKSSTYLGIFFLYF